MTPDDRTKSRHIALISMGSNLARRSVVHPGARQPLDTLREAVGAIGDLPGVTISRLSRWYRSTPIPPSPQPDYINAMVAAELEDVPPETLLTALLQIETALGRVRSVANAARTIDLDIIGIDQLVRDTPELILPHPRAHLRAFVLMPLLDVAPAWIHPLLSQPASTLLGRLPDQGVCVLPDDAAAS